MEKEYENPFRIGYARVSREDQNLDMQTRLILKAGVIEDNLFVEKVSGVSSKRPQLDLCLKRLRAGDTLVVYKLDRIGRSLSDLCKLAEKFKERRIVLVSLTESIDTNTAMGQLFFHIMAALAQFERDLISERTAAGLAAAKERGTWRSRPVTFTQESYERAIAAYKDNDGLSMKQIAKASGLKQSQVNKHLDKIKAAVPWQWGDNVIKKLKRKK